MMFLTLRKLLAIVVTCMCVLILLVARKTTGNVFPPPTLYTGRVEEEFFVATMFATLALGQYPIAFMSVTGICLLVKSSMTFCPEGQSFVMNMIASFFDDITRFIVSVIKRTERCSIIWLSRHAFVVLLAVLVLCALNCHLDRRAQSRMRDAEAQKVRAEILVKEEKQKQETVLANKAKAVADILTGKARD